MMTPGLSFFYEVAYLACILDRDTYEMSMHCAELNAYGIDQFHYIISTNVCSYRVDSCKAQRQNYEYGQHAESMGAYIISKMFTPPPTPAPVQHVRN